MSVNAVMAQTFLPGVRNWNTSVSRRDIEVFDPQARKSCLHDTWQLYDIIHPKIVVSHLKLSKNGAAPQIGQYNPAKKHLWNYEFCLTQHKHIVMNLILRSTSTSFESLQCHRHIGHVETETMQTADWRLCRLCRLSVIFFLLVP